MSRLVKQFSKENLLTLSVPTQSISNLISLQLLFIRMFPSSEKPVALFKPAVDLTCTVSAPYLTPAPALTCTQSVGFRTIRKFALCPLDC